MCISVLAGHVILLNVWRGSAHAVEKVNSTPQLHTSSQRTVCLLRLAIILGACLFYHPNGITVVVYPDCFMFISSVSSKYVCKPDAVAYEWRLEIISGVCSPHGSYHVSGQ